MAKRVVSLKLEPALLARVDAVAENRNAWVTKAIMASLSEEEGAAPAPDSRTVYKNPTRPEAKAIKPEISAFEVRVRDLARTMPRRNAENQARKEGLAG